MSLAREKEISFYLPTRVREGLTRVLKPDQEPELGSVSGHRDEEDSVRGGNDGESVKASVACGRGGPGVKPELKLRVKEQKERTDRVPGARSTKRSIVIS